MWWRDLYVSSCGVPSSKILETRATFPVVVLIDLFLFLVFVFLDFSWPIPCFPYRPEFRCFCALCMLNLFLPLLAVQTNHTHKSPSLAHECHVLAPSLSARSSASKTAGPLGRQGARALRWGRAAGRRREGEGRRLPRWSGCRASPGSGRGRRMRCSSGENGEWITRKMDLGLLLWVVSSTT